MPTHDDPSPTWPGAERVRRRGLWRWLRRAPKAPPTRAELVAEASRLASEARHDTAKLHQRDDWQPDVNEHMSEWADITGRPNL